VQVLGDRQPDVEADEVGGAQRAHRVAVAQLHGGVDGFGVRDPLLEHADGLQPQQHAQPGGGEPRGVLHHDVGLAQGAHPAAGDPDQLGGCLLRDHHLHELRRRHRIEEVQAEEPARALEYRGQLRHRQGAGVGGQHGVRGDGCLRGPQHLGLEVGLLGDGLDHQAGLPVQRGGRVHHGQPVQDRGDVAVELPSPGGLLQAVSDTPAGGLGSLPAGLHDRDPGAGRQEDLRDACAHAAAPDDAHPGRHGGHTFSTSIATP
jgi:hypothetical protein